MDEAIRRFIEHLAVAGRSPHTLAAYRADIELLKT